MRLGGLRGSVEEIRDSDFDTDELEVPESLVARVRGLLEDALSTLGAALDHYEPIEATRCDEAAGGDIEDYESPDVSAERAIISDDGLSRLITVAFLGRYSLREHLGGMLTAIRAGGFEAVDHMDGSLREVVRVATALDTAIAEYEGLEVDRSRYASEVQIAVETRRAYHRFREEIVSGEQPKKSDIAARMRSIGVSIAKLGGRPVFPHLRARDRHQLRGLQQRLVDFLRLLGSPTRADAPDSIVNEAFRLFQECVSVSELMMTVNNRAELRAHDAALAQRALEALDDAPLCEVLRVLKPLLGRHAELDEYLESRRSLDSEELRELLHSLVHHIDNDGSARRSYMAAV